MKWIQWLFWAGMALAFVGCEGQAPQGQSPSTTRQRVYRPLLTEVAEDTFEVGDLLEINTAYCLLFDRITDSSEVWLATHEFTLAGVLYRLIYQLGEHPGAKAHLLFDPRLFEATKPDHRITLLDSLRNFAAHHPGQLFLENMGHPQAGIIGDHPSEPLPRMHAKFMVMNHLAPALGDSFRSCLIVSSANLSYAEAAESNEAVLLPEHPVLENAAIAYFKAMAGHAAAPPTPFIAEDKVGLWFFPAEKGQDPIRNILDSLRAREPHLSKFPDPMRIRIAISHWDSARSYLADDLVQLSKSPYVDVKVLLREDLDISPIVRQKLSGLGKGRVRIVPAKTPKAKNGIHSKLLFAEYPVGEGMEYRVWWGSHNWNMPSLTTNSEMLCEIKDFEVYYAMWNHWNALWEAGIEAPEIFKLPY